MENSEKQRKWKKRTLYNALIGALAIAAVFCITKTARADYDTVYNYGTGNYVYLNVVDAQMGGIYQQLQYGQQVDQWTSSYPTNEQFAPQENGTLDQIEVSWARDAGSTHDPVYATIYLKTGGSDGTVIASTTASITGTTNHRQWLSSWSAHPTLSVGTTYWIYYEVNPNPPPPPPPLQETSIIYPFNTSTTSDFANWILDVTSTEYGRVGVEYGTDPLLLNFTDEDVYSPFVNVHENYVLNKHLLLNPIVNLYSSSTWYARAFYETSSSVRFPSSQGIISFVINPTYTVTTGGIPSSTAEAIIKAKPFNSNIQQLGALNPSSTVSWSFNVDCSAYSGSFWAAVSGDGIVCFIKKGALGIAQFLFSPSQNSTDYLQYNLGHLQQYFPFNIAFGFHNSIVQYAGVYATSTIPDKSLTIHLPYGFGNMPVLSSTTLSDVVGSSTKNMIFTGEGDLMYAASAYLIYLFIVM